MFRLTSKRHTLHYASRLGLVYPVLGYSPPEHPPPGALSTFLDGSGPYWKLGEYGLRSFQPLGYAQPVSDDCATFVSGIVAGASVQAVGTTHQLC